ncbi:MAG: SAF domain-containing protein [Nitriliruptoraceae bacterium]
MADVPTAPTSEHTGHANDRVIRPARRRINVRVVVGTALIAVSAFGALQLGQRADAPPTTRYLVATDDVDVGTVVGPGDEQLPVGSAAIELPPGIARNAIRSQARDELVGRVTAAPIAAGDLLRWSDVVTAPAFSAKHETAVSLPPRDALAGDVSPGMQVDVLATYSGSGRSFTDYLARDVPVLAVDRGDRGLADDEIILRLGLDSPSDVQAVGHAQRTANVFLARAISDQTSAMPSRYRVESADDVLADLTPRGAASAPDALER